MNARDLLLIGPTLLAVALALFLPAVPQPIAYHDFADKREAYGIENFLDVTSNLAFALAGAAGLLLVLRPRTCFASPAERWPYLLFCRACCSQPRAHATTTSSRTMTRCSGTDCQ
jgi:hypothetical protein